MNQNTKEVMALKGTLLSTEIMSPTLLVGKEFNVGQKQIIGLGLKSTVAGGKRYGFPDVAQTEALNEIIFMDSAFNDDSLKITDST